MDLTTRLLEHCQAFGVPKVVLLSSANVYGPRPDNPQFLTEDAPLLAAQRFPAMRDLVEIGDVAQRARRHLEDEHLGVARGGEERQRRPDLGVEVLRRGHRAPVGARHPVQQVLRRGLAG